MPSELIILDIFNSKCYKFQNVVSLPRLSKRVRDENGQEKLFRRNAQFC